MFIPVIYGSVRLERQGIKAARFVENELKERGHEVVLIDPLDYNLPFLDKMYKEYAKGEAPENLQKLAGIFLKADAFVIVTGEYNRTMPPALINLLDYFLEEFFWRPSAIVSYSAGSFAGVRAAENSRTILAELGMPAIPSAFPIGKVQDSFDDEGKPTEAGKAYPERIKRFLSELEWYAEALKNQREKGTPY
ncbi:NAD(P)H-dependent oxidoreductase [Candidatus Micrarchaeota archaeon]|nr:NAD(P)H-dependent oxidoreductase [Candidatus Micrarchaeota archaeon]